MRPDTSKRTSAAPAPASQRDPDDLGDDLLVGIGSIAAFLKQPRRRVQHWADTGAIPLSKTGFLWTGMKSELRRHFTGNRKSNAA